MRSLVSRAFILCFLLLAPAAAQAADQPLGGMDFVWAGECTNQTGTFPCKVFKKGDEPDVKYIAVYDQQAVSMLYVLREADGNQTVFWQKPTRDLLIHYPQESRRH